MNNEVKVQGKIKNIRVMTTKSGTQFVTGWFDQREISSFGDGRHDRQVYVFGINIVSYDADTIKFLCVLDSQRQGQPATQLVNVTGRLQSRFDKRAVAESDKRPPQLQLIVDELELV